MLGVPYDLRQQAALLAAESVRECMPPPHRGITVLRYGSFNAVR